MPLLQSLVSNAEASPTSLQALVDHVIRSPWAAKRKDNNKTTWLPRTNADDALALSKNPHLGELAVLAADGYGSIEIERARAVLLAASELLAPPGPFDLKANPNQFKVDSASPRDWTTAKNLFRSGAGLTGVYFVDMGSQGNVVVKRVETVHEVQNDTLMRLLKKYMNIACPEEVFVPKSSPEFALIEAGLKRPYEPYHMDLWESSSPGASPKADRLFSSDTHSIKLMELLRAKPLSLRLGSSAEEEQRELTMDDFEALGRILLFDAIVRNTDRFPLKRFFYPNSQPGNPGNLMCSPDSLYAIDEAIQLGDLEEHKMTVRSIIDDVCGHFPVERFKVVKLWTGSADLPGPVDSLELCNWESDKASADLLPVVEERLAAIRVEVEALKERERTEANETRPADSTHWLKSPVPAGSSRVEWLEWSALALPRSLNDVARFIRESTSLRVGAQAIEAMRSGFQSGMLAVARTHAALAAGAMHVDASSVLKNSSDFVGHIRSIMEEVAGEADRLKIKERKSVEVRSWWRSAASKVVRKRHKASGFLSDIAKLLSLYGAAELPEEELMKRLSESIDLGDEEVFE
jgi:hypothetical protein